MSARPLARAFRILTERQLEENREKDAEWLTEAEREERTVDEG